jgi:hypothetical protein
MKNNSPIECNATVTIDDNNIGTWRLYSYQTTTIERPSRINKKFIFVKANSNRGFLAGLLPGKSSNGLVCVEFTPELKIYPQAYPNSTRQVMALSTNSYSEGGTGLQGKSDQSFGKAKPITLDYSKTKTINLRLVVDETNYHNITPLNTSYTDIPPPVSSNQPSSVGFPPLPI